jgi:hypothetical protein
MGGERFARLLLALKGLYGLLRDAAGKTIS